MTTKKATPKEVEAVQEAMSRGEGLPSGWGYDPLQDPPVFKLDADDLKALEEPGGDTAD